VASIKTLVRPLLPQTVVDLWRARAAARIDARFSQLPPADIFGEIYRRRLWGGTSVADYCSGEGSHNEAILRPYVQAVRAFLEGFDLKPDVADLGCGDFNVGSRVRDACARFVACDVVAGLIDRNSGRFAGLDVSFSQLDITASALPEADVAFLRQVLQHLNNQQIASVVRKLGQYSWVVVTEHVPRNRNFPANLDKSTGPGVRLRFGSGVVLTRAPFDLRPLEQRLLCSIPETSGLVQTIAYRLRA
jgi:hypothetical protein